MIIVDRDSFIAYTQGILLDRDATGRCVVGDNKTHEAAEEALERGERIGLTINSVLFSYITPSKDGYVENEVN